MLGGKELTITLSLLNDFLSARPLNLTKVTLIESPDLGLSKCATAL